MNRSSEEWCIPVLVWEGGNEGFFVIVVSDEDGVYEHGLSSS